MISQESDFFFIVDQSGNYEAKNIRGQREAILFKDIREERKRENALKHLACVSINMRVLRDYSMRSCIHHCSMGTFTENG